MRTLLIGLSLLTLWGCNPESRGFVLPEGDVAAGKASFQALHCTQCHSIGDVAWQGGAEDLELPLGGRTTSLKTYGELLTSVINPSHRIARRDLQEQVAVDGESTMRVYNEVMTVQELVDIVSYLQTEYEVVVPGYPYNYRRW
jgi:mono/diheme cytochrome c family protein